MEGAWQYGQLMGPVRLSVPHRSGLRPFTGRCKKRCASVPAVNGPNRCIHLMKIGQFVHSPSPVSRQFGCRFIAGGSFAFPNGRSVEWGHHRSGRGCGGKSVRLARETSSPAGERGRSWNQGHTGRAKNGVTPAPILSPPPGKNGATSRSSDRLIPESGALEGFNQPASLSPATVAATQPKGPSDQARMVAFTMVPISNLAPLRRAPAGLFHRWQSLLAS